MTARFDSFLKHLYQQFTEYYTQFLKIAERSTALFIAGQMENRVQDDLHRLQLYRLAINKSVGFAKTTLRKDLYRLPVWRDLRMRFRELYANELASTYFTSVMRKVFVEDEVSIEYDDDGITPILVESEEIVTRISLGKKTGLTAATQMALGESAFADGKKERFEQDIDIIVDIICEHLPQDDRIRSLELLKPPFFRGKGGYLVGQFRTHEAVVPLVFCCVHSNGGIRVDAVLVGYKATRSFLFSSTRSAFTVSTRCYRELYSFLQRLFPEENPAYILDIIGFAHPAKISLLQQLRTFTQTGVRFRYLGIGPIDFVFGIEGFPLVFKVIRGGVSDREDIIKNYIKVHTIDRSGQVLDSLDYRNLKFPKHQFSQALIRKLHQERPEDVMITDEHIFFKRVYAARKIVPVNEQVKLEGKSQTRELLLRVGWNIKHLAAMGFVPQALGLEHFGLTSWGRVVYLNNPALVDIRMFSFQPGKNRDSDQGLYHVNPAEFEAQINIPQPHRDMFRAIHGDLFSPKFWEDIRATVMSGHYPDFFPYPARYRVGSRKFRSSVFEELERMSDQAEPNQIHMALNSLAVADVELVGLSFLRLEVPNPSARVLVVEPIGPEIIAQLHHRFKDVTFDILQSESEIVESAGQWAPGIHGKLDALVQVRRYDYVIGYVNEHFDEAFFKLAKLKGFLLLSTGTHNIDIKAATGFHTVVTNAPGPTTTTVAEQNIGLILDALYSHAVHYSKNAEGYTRVIDNRALLAEHLAVARALWLCFLQKTLKLEQMFSFGASAFYVRTGIGERATVYHDQIGQNKEAGITSKLGVIGLGEIGLHLLEFAIGHEVSTLYVSQVEYEVLSEKDKRRLKDLILVKQETTSPHEVTIKLITASLEEIYRRADYVFDTRLSGFEDTFKASNGHKIHIDIKHLHEKDFLQVCQAATADLTLGIHGLGRIGEAVAQRAIILGLNILIFQRDPNRPKYQNKLSNLRKLADQHADILGRTPTVGFAYTKDMFFKSSNIITTLAATTDATLGWVDQRGLSLFGRETQSPVRALVSAGKGLVDEEALIAFLQKHPNAQARLDVLAGEHEGGSILKWVDSDGRPLKNIKVSGHTAAAVREVRQLKIFKALDNLRNLIDGRIPPNIVNNAITKGSSKAKQELVEFEALRFFRISVPSPRAKVLVIEPLPPEMVLHIQQAFGDVSFDILLAESELIEVDGHWLPGINSRLNNIVTAHRYDYCLGYCNANFDTSFFTQARLKGLILFATATHHIDMTTASKMGTTVTNSPGFTTVAVTEQNIGMALEALYGKYVQSSIADGATSLCEIDYSQTETAQTAAQLMWYMLMRRALRLDAMYEFGVGNKYVRTGVRQDATVYHDQLGQHSQAGIHNTIGIIGLDEVGVCLIELAFAFEVKTVLVLEQEYQNLPSKQKERLKELLDLLPEVVATKGISFELKPVELDELIQDSTYAFKTPSSFSKRDLAEIKPISSINILANRVYINDLTVFDRSMIGLNFGVQGLGRIGEAVVQRALALGADITICQRNPDRVKYQQKQNRLQRFADNRAKTFKTGMMVRYVNKQELFATSNIVTTLAKTTNQTKYWVDLEALQTLSSDATGAVSILVNAGKGLLNESDLERFLKERQDVEVRLDVLTDEQIGKAGTRFIDENGRPFANLKIAGHTAAAVPELRRLKMLNALNNLRLHLDGHTPNNILNPEAIDSESGALLSKGSGST